MSPDDSQQSTIDLLNGLIETTLDGKQGFTDAARHAHAPELRELMASYSAECARSARQLQDCVRGLGGEPETGGTASGALHRGWVNLKASLSSDDDLMLLEECERGEDHARTEYLKAMRATLSPEVRTLLLRQTEGTRIHHERIRELRNRSRADGAAY